jgi:hypothetical protein
MEVTMGWPCSCDGGDKNLYHYNDWKGEGSKILR